MSGEIVVPETPNWLNALEEKREKRLKARLGHEAGAGAPCLKCEDKCPGLDLHFWRKACKICRCPKEEHDVHDDDIYGWAQFQLLGSKPNKIKTKITLPGKKDEVELEWAPKGQKDTIDKYLKTLPPESLPVKGSQAAQDRKQMLQKQIPIHDIDPSLCHELNEEEVQKMEEYIAHIKKSSVGVGQIVSLSSVIKANLHNISPQEAHIIASRYAKGVPFSEIVKLQSGLAKNLENLSLKDSKNKSILPTMHPNQRAPLTEQNVQSSLTPAKYKDITHPWYTKSEPGRGDTLHPQYSGQLGGPEDYNIDSKLLQGTNFNPANTPSQFYRPNNDSHGFENPYFTHMVPGASGSNPYNDQRDPKNPRSVKDLIYSTYDPSKGPIPEDHSADSLKNRLPEPQFDPRAPLNTYKHDPSVIRSSNPHLVGTNDYGQYVGQPEHSVPLNASENALIDPVTGKYVYNTYDPSTGPVSKDLGGDSLKNRLPEPQFDPRGPLNAYKHDPSVIRSSNPHLVGTNDFGQYVGQPEHSVPLNASEKATVDPVTGKYVHSTYKGQIPKDHRVQTAQFDPRDGLKSANPHLVATNDYSQRVGHPEHSVPLNASGNAPVDPVTGNYVYSSYDPSTSAVSKDLGGDSLKNRLQKPQFDPTGSLNTYKHDPSVIRSPNPHLVGTNDYGQYVGHPEHSNASENATIDPLTGKYTSYREPKVPQFDPSAANPHLVGTINDQHSIPLQGGPFKGPKKPLSHLEPSRLTVSEDYLEPHQVNIGAIQDINPDIRAATAEPNPGFDSFSDYEPDYSPDSIREILNNIKLPDCHYCKKPFEENEFAVTIDRANVLFHAQCFKCAGCNQSLADNIYFYHKESDKVYCGRDYAMIKGYPRCAACDELIFTKEYCLAEQSTFHLKHFCCFQCDSPLAGQDYTLEEDKPYCLPCYETSKAAKCSTCQMVIKHNEVGCQLNGVHFHVEDCCFRCIMCSLPLMGKKLLLRNEKLFCSHDCFNTANCS